MGPQSVCPPIAVSLQQLKEGWECGEQREWALWLSYCLRVGGSVNPLKGVKQYKCYTAQKGTLLNANMLP